LLALKGHAAAFYDDGDDDDGDDDDDAGDGSNSAASGEDGAGEMIFITGSLLFVVDIISMFALCGLRLGLLPLKLCPAVLVITLSPCRPTIPTRFRGGD